MLKTLLSTAALLSALPVQAQISVGSPAFTYSQNFDTLTTTLTTTVPWANDSTLAGWSLFNSLNAAITTYGADNGGNTTGTFRSYGSTGSVERALGSLASGGAYFGSPASGALAGYIAVSFNNTSATAYDSVTLGFDGEQWRNGGVVAQQSLVLAYGFGATFATVATWTPAGSSFNLVSPVTSTTGAAVDGNIAGKVAGLGGTVATSWAAGDTLWVRWTDLNDVGSDHGLAIDNFTLSVTAVPEPGSTALLLAGLGIVAFVARRSRLG